MSKRCAQCGCPGTEESHNGGIGLRKPWWIFFFPVPLLSALTVNCFGPSFCSEGCRNQYERENPNAFKKAFILSHVAAPLTLALMGVLAVLFAIFNENKTEEKTSQQPETEQVQEQAPSAN